MIRIHCGLSPPVADSEKECREDQLEFGLLRFELVLKIARALQWKQSEGHESLERLKARFSSDILGLGMSLGPFGKVYDRFGFSRSEVKAFYTLFDRYDADLSGCGKLQKAPRRHANLYIVQI